jgi:hypothetical protein
MTTTTDATIEVATVDLRHALQAVTPHAEKNKTGDNAVDHRVRLVFAAEELYVLATNGTTTGCAAVPIDADSRDERFAADDGAFLVDITPRQARLVVSHFAVGRGSGDEMDEMLELNATTKALTITDSGGLFEGESVEFPTLDTASNYPDVPAILGRALAGVGATQVGKPLVADGTVLSLFRQASDAYGQPLEHLATGTEDSRGFVIACGAWFRGTVESRHNDDDWQKQRESSHRSWLGRFPAAKLAAV